jgi:probable phosphoglycerate mutase
MLQIALIRPGSTDYDVQQRIQGSLDIPLNDRGLAEVDQTAERLRGRGIEAIYAPASQPAMQTAERIAKSLSVKWKKIERLQSLRQGLWEGMLVEDVRYKQPKVYRQWQEQPEHVCPAEGEMLSEADQRVRAALTKLLRRNKNGIIGIVLPEPLLSLARRLLTGGELGDLWKATNGHDRVELIEVNVEELLPSP